MNELLETPFENIKPCDYDRVITELQGRLEATERKLAIAERVINSGLITHGGQKPYRVTMCNTFYPKSAMDKDTTLCVDVTEALAEVKK